MSYKNTEEGRKKHADYMRTVWYPKNKDRHIASVRKLKKKLSLFVENYKRNSICADCGFSGKDFPQVLEFDHVKGIKLFEIGVFQQYVLSFESLKIEIEKCELVCANCHRIRTFKRRGAL